MIMKKLFRLMSVALVAMLFAACSSNTPEAVVKSYLKSMQKGDYATAVKLMGIEDKDGEFAAMMEAKGKEVTEKAGGIKSFEVGKAEMAEDGQSAVVPYVVKFGDGETKEDTQKVKLVEGKWLIDIGK